MPAAREASMTSPAKFTASISSEVPYLRPFGYERLLHAPEAIDLARVKGGLPVLFAHDHARPIGIGRNVHLRDRRLVADVELFDLPLAREVAAMIAGGLHNISVGYAVNQMRRTGTLKGEPVYTVDDWAVLEMSYVACPADHTVGIGRAAFPIIRR